MATKRTKKKVTKWQYLGETDPAQFIWSNKTHRSASEAFRDADYATAFWREKTEWERACEYTKWIVMWAGLLYFLYALAVWFNEVVA
jgi:hypothetical protein